MLGRAFTELSACRTAASRRPPVRCRTSPGALVAVAVQARMQSGGAGAAGGGSGNRAVIWFRGTDLRLHDNAIVHEAARRVEAGQVAEVRWAMHPESPTPGLGPYHATPAATPPSWLLLIPAAARCCPCCCCRCCRCSALTRATSRPAPGAAQRRGSSGRASCWKACGTSRPGCAPWAATCSSAWAGPRR